MITAVATADTTTGVTIYYLQQQLVVLEDINETEAEGFSEEQRLSGHLTHWALKAGFSRELNFLAVNSDNNRNLW